LEKEKDMNMRLASLGVPFVLLFTAIGVISSRELALNEAINRIFFLASLPSLLTVALMVAQKIVRKESLVGRLLAAVEGLADLERPLYKRSFKSAIALVVAFAAVLDLIAWRWGGYPPLNAYLVVGLVLGMLSAYVL
jgi:hypothetical protein